MGKLESSQGPLQHQLLFCILVVLEVVLAFTLQEAKFMLSDHILIAAMNWETQGT